MKKTLLAVAITALSANAFAVNLDTPTTPDTQVFASEIDVTAPVVLGTLTKLKTEGGLGFALTNSYVRYELSNGATFGTAVAAADLTSPVAVIPYTQYAGAISVAGGGTVGSNYVIFNLGGAALATDKLVFQHSAKVTSQSAVTVSYSLHQQASDAVNKTNNLSSKSGTLLSFAKGLVVTTTSAVSKNIDAIKAASKRFTGGAAPADLSESLVTLNLAPAVPAVAKIDGSPATALADLVNLTGTKWTVSGNFSAAAGDAGTGVIGTAGYTLSADKQSATKTTVTAAEAVAYTVSGTADIAETAISATLTPVAATGMKIAPVTISNIAELKNNGNSDNAELALKPGGAYANYVRISNTGSVATLFTLKVTNDAGNAVTINLADVAGQSATPIAAGASTTQITIDAIYAAAQAKGLTLTGDGKLRLQVTGATTAVDMQTYTVSKDANSFATF